MSKVLNAEEIAIKKEAEQVEKTLTEYLSKVRIKVDKVENADVIEAIDEVFGSRFVSNHNNIYITYEMYSKCLDLIRDIGALYAEEHIK